jgi:hypothetical protein
MSKEAGYVFGALLLAGLLFYLYVEERKQALSTANASLPDWLQKADGIIKQLKNIFSGKG